MIFLRLELVVAEMYVKQERRIHGKVKYLILIKN